jgi:hypothetical protein
MWTKYFNMVKVRRGRVITPRHGEIDFSLDDIPVETCKELFEEDFPYLEITEEGKRELYGIEPTEKSKPEIEILQETVEPKDSPPNRKKYKKRKP